MKWNLRYVCGAGCATALALFAAYLVAQDKNAGIIFLVVALIIGAITFDD